MKKPLLILLLGMCIFPISPPEFDFEIKEEWAYLFIQQKKAYGMGVPKIYQKFTKIYLKFHKFYKIYLKPKNHKFKKCKFISF